MKTATQRFRKTVVVRALITACCGTASMIVAQPAFAQDSSQPSLQRVEITGSAIKRVEAETAVPVTILKIEDLKEQGITTVEEIVNTLSGNQAVVGTSQSVGAGYGGASFANMRGLGRNKTLVLLNGRRITNNAIDSSAPDLNAIPIAAIERVEVLRDGASSLYGTDAIGGVINFITRKDFVGGTATIGFDSPQHPGGKSKNFNLGYGVGDLQKSNYNIFGFLDYQKQDALTTLQRDFGGTKTSGVPYPGVYFSDASNATVSPYAPKCDGAPFNVFSKPYACRYLYWKWVDDIPASERLSGMLKGTINLPNDRQVNLEYFATKTKVISNIAPVPYGSLQVNPGTKYFPGNGITAAPPADAGFDLTQPIYVNWRDIPNGARQDTNENTQQRFVASTDGVIAGWDYQTALTWGENKVTDTLTSGYTNGDIITAGMLNGTINPFGAQDPAGQALLDSANARGGLLRAKGTVTSLDGHASRELDDWFKVGRKPAVAVGFEVRHEVMEEKATDPAFATQVIASTGFDPSTNNTGARTIAALYGELNVPVVKTLDVTAAARYDHYSDFGSTFNPKLSFRFQPNDKLLVRGSASTGFRAPSLYDLHQSQQYTNTANNWNDPARCPGGTPIAGAPAATNCETQFMSLIGGNPSLKAETSKSLNFGFVLQPVQEFDAGLDFWWIKLKHQINPLADDVVFGDPNKYASAFVRAPDGSLSTTGSQCPGANCGYVSLLTNNLGGVNTNGVDLSLAYRMRMQNASHLNFKLVSTYVNKYEYQAEEDGPWIQNVGVYSNGNPIFRWQHNASVTWNNQMWTVGLVGHFKSGYVDEDGTSNVGDYTTWDIYGSWRPTKPLTVTFGVRNMLDTKPPSSIQSATFQVGYDPRFADPLMRTFYVRGTYRF